MVSKLDRNVPAQSRGHKSASFFWPSARTATIVNAAAVGASARLGKEYKRRQNAGLYENLQ